MNKNFDFNAICGFLVKIIVGSSIIINAICGFLNIGINPISTGLGWTIVLILYWYIFIHEDKLK